MTTAGDRAASGAAACNSVPAVGSACARSNSCFALLFTNAAALRFSALPPKKCISIKSEEATDMSKKIHIPVKRAKATPATSGNRIVISIMPSFRGAGGSTITGVKGEESCEGMGSSGAFPGGKMTHSEVPTIQGLFHCRI